MIPSANEGRTTNVITNLAGLNDPRGSRWRRWDLHVHTPASIIQNYGGDTPQAWQKYLTNLRSLPGEFAVIAITDYLFLDGYKRVRDEHNAGNLPNLILILPAVEFRIKSFSGTDSTLRKINYHVIFSNELDAQQIEKQFLNLLTADYYLNDRDHWNKVVDRDTLIEFGNRVLDNNPELRATNTTPLKAGFNNLTFSLEQLEEKLTTNTALNDKYITAIGLNEWNDMRWQQSSADKRNIIERVDFVLTSADTPDACRTAREKLIKQRVNNRLLDASDAHDFSDSDDKDRLGNCYTWIKADPTFKGLQQVRRAADERIYLGEQPPKEALVAANPTKFVKSITITPKPGVTPTEQWFNHTIPFNHDLVAIIGRKGMGKSALTDIISLAGNAKLSSTNYSFLRTDRFRDAKNKAGQFQATITWEAGAPLTRGLEEIVPETAAPQVRYIPQHYFERVCNETEVTESGAFQQELRSVIFSHVKESERGDATTLDELITSRTSETTREITTLRAAIHDLNRAIVQHERALTAATDEELLAAETLLQRELDAHLANVPEEKTLPADVETPPELTTARSTLAKLVSDQQHQREEQRTKTVALNELQQLTQALNNTLKYIEDAKTRLEPTLAKYGLTFDELLMVLSNLGALDAITTSTNTRLQELATALIANATAQDTERATITKTEAALDAPQREYEAYVTARTLWQQRRDELVGDEHTPNTLTYVKTRRTTGKTSIAAELDTLRTQREEKTLELFIAVSATVALRRTLYRDVQVFVDQHESIKEHLPVFFDAHLSTNDFVEQLQDRINRSRVGRFRETEHLKDILRQHDVNTSDGILALIDTILRDLSTDLLGGTRDIDHLENQLKRGDAEALYNYLFGLEYLRPQYSLRVRDRDVTLLSPGERGILLLVFYLLVDRDPRPLVIDQPEENLDNESVYQLLVPCIKDAKQRRQVFLVTHNPNLAVVCNAEQVIWTSIDKEQGNSVTYETGSIENPATNTHLVNVLEGTRPAFNDRGSKYHEP